MQAVDAKGLKTSYKPISQALVAFLQDKKDGESFDFKTLSDAAGADIRNGSVVLSAKKSLLKKGKLLVSIKGFGYKIADTKSKIAESSAYRRRSLKAVNRSYKILRSVDQNTLDNTTRPEFQTELVKTLNLTAMHDALDNKALATIAPKQIEQADLLKHLL